MGLSNHSTLASKVANGTPYYFFLETFPNSLKTLSLFCMYKCFACMMSVHHLCLVLKEARRGHGILWNWSYREV